MVYDRKRVKLRGRCGGTTFPMVGGWLPDNRPFESLISDAEGLMAPPLDPDKLKAMMKNPFAADMIGKDIELLKLKQRKKEEEECAIIGLEMLQLMTGDSRRLAACCRLFSVRCSVR